MDGGCVPLRDQPQRLAVLKTWKNTGALRRSSALRRVFQTQPRSIRPQIFLFVFLLLFVAPVARLARSYPEKIILQEPPHFFRSPAGGWPAKERLPHQPHSAIFQNSLLE